MYASRLKEILINLEVNPQVLEEWSGDKSFIEFILIKGILTKKQTEEILLKYFSVESFDFSEIQPEALEILPDINLKYKILPFKTEGDTLHVAMVNPFDQEVLETIRHFSGKKVRAYFADQREIEYYINQYDTRNTIEKSASAETIINSFIDSAILQRASDIHLEHGSENARLRYRIDGVLKEGRHMDSETAKSVVSRLKIISGLDIGQSRLPMDGSFKKDNTVDFRISTMPTIFGEKVVIRLIYKEGLDFSLEKNNLGFSQKDTALIKNLLQKKSGAILVTGPTGSGKTTTLSAFLTFLNKSGINITTIEDPVENIIKGVNHVNINPQIGLDFNGVLKHILRQDPDIIMLGEIRDKETASTLIKAAITGHLVLSTLHTNDGLSTINRLLDMDVEKYLLADALAGIISQRLVRRLCTCKIAVKPPAPMEKQYAIHEIYAPRGCRECFSTGYKGRFAVYEILTMTEDLKNHILTKTQITPDKGLSLKDKALAHLKEGNTSLEEVYALIDEDFFV